MHPALQIVPRRTQIAQFLGAHDLIVFACFIQCSLFRRNGLVIQLHDLGFTSRYIQGQLIVKLQRLFIEQVKRFDVFQQRMLMGQQIVGDPINLALYLFKSSRELGEGRRTPKQLFPPALLATHVEFRDRKAANCADHRAQAITRRADILVAHIGEHGLADHLQFCLRGRAKADDGLRIGYVNLGHALLNFRALGRIGLGQGHDGIGVCGFGQDCCVHFFDQPLRLGGFFTDGIGHH